jgi:hypothetical protein
LENFNATAATDFKMSASTHPIVAHYASDAFCSPKAAQTHFPASPAHINMNADRSIQNARNESLNIVHSLTS